MEKNHTVSEIRRYLLQLYSGMFAGLVFVTCIAGCVGIANTVTEIASLLLVCLTSAVMFFVANQ